MVRLSKPREAAPTPWSTLRAMRMSNSLTRAQAPPANPKRKREGTSIRLRPHLSARMPINGVRTTPGRVKAVISIPTSVLDMFNSSIIRGKAGVMLDTPNTAIRVTLDII